MSSPEPPSAAVDPAVERRIVQRPDGYHWLTADGRRESEAFSSYGQAEFDLRADEDLDVAPDALLAEVEDEIGMAGWIDPETGEPAEEERPRLEQH